MITELYLSHYRSIAEETIPLRQINVFVGKNGSGKSNIVDAISFLADLVNDDLDYAITKRHGADSIRQWNRSRPFHVTIQVKTSSSEGNGLYKLVFSSSRNFYRVQEEIVEWDGELAYNYDHYRTTIRRGADGVLSVVTDNESEDVDISKVRIDSAESVLKYLSSTADDIRYLVSYLLSELRSFAIFTIFPNTIRAPQTVSRAPTLEPDGKNIASIIKQMVGETKKNRDRIIKALKVVLPSLVGINVRSTAGYYVPVLSVSDGAETHELNMSQVSDGTLRMLGILTAIHQPRAPLKIALEEPEQMIHPALLAVITDAVKSYTRRRKEGQVFITTHSAVLIDLFDVEDILAVETRNGSTHCGPISKRQLKVVKSGLMSVGDILLAEDLEVA